MKNNTSILKKVLPKVLLIQSGSATDIFGPSISSKSVAVKTQCKTNNYKRGGNKNPKKKSKNAKISIREKRKLDRKKNRNMKRSRVSRFNESDICKHSCTEKYNFTDRKKIILSCHDTHVSISFLHGFIFYCVLIIFLILCVFVLNSTSIFVRNVRNNV